MVFQNHALYPHMTVGGNIAFGLQMRGFSGLEVASRVAEAAARLAIDHLLERKPRQLSGGERQRVALARALVRRPRVFLLDEPLAGLDPMLRDVALREIATLFRDLGVTTIYVTHDQREAIVLADVLVVLKAGRIQQCGTPHEVYCRPVDRFVAGFFGRLPMAFLEGVAIKEDPDWTIATDRHRLLSVPGSAFPRAVQDGEAIVVGVRPEDVEAIRLSEATKDTDRSDRDAGLSVFLRGRVRRAEGLGCKRCLVVDVPGGSIGAAPPPLTAWTVGESVGLKLPASRLHYFSLSGKRLPAPEDQASRPQQLA